MFGGSEPGVILISCSTSLFGDAPLAESQEIHLCIPGLLLGDLDDKTDVQTVLIPVPSPGQT